MTTPDRTRFIIMKLFPTLGAWLFATAVFAAAPVVFNARTAQSGNWSDARTWAGQRSPRAGDFVCESETRLRGILPNAFNNAMSKAILGETIEMETRLKEKMIELAMKDLAPKGFEVR